MEKQLLYEHTKKLASTRETLIRLETRLEAIQNQRVCCQKDVQQQLENLNKKLYQLEENQKKHDESFRTITKLGGAIGSTAIILIPILLELTKTLTTQ
jgi:TolA-binding protein